ncbi:MAG: flippase-like domain-containing protein [Thermoleophilaceae bacterium]|nr:flippase-like domain-containing protein [Thermoleophilaceae bacterium]
MPVGRGGGDLYDREISPDSDSPHPKEFDDAIDDVVDELLDQKDDEGGDDQVEQAWEVFKTQFFSRRTLFAAVAFIVLVLAFLYGVLPQLPGLQDSLRTVQEEGDRTWLAVAFCMELLSYASYIWLFRAVFIAQIPVIGWLGSYRISMAGVAATRLFGAAGAGGIALTFWAVRKAGMGKRMSVSYLVAFYVILYGIFMIALVVDGVLLRTGAIPGAAPFAVTVIPAIFGGLVISIFLLALLVPGNLEHLAERWSTGSGRVANIARKLAAVPALIGQGTRVGIGLVRKGDLGLLGALGWWAFDIATLWACFKAFGDSPTMGVLIMGYFVGMIANIIPTPGGVGAVEGGMIGTYLAFGVGLGSATAAVLAYRVFAFLMPTIPGVIAFIGLRGTVADWQPEGATIQSKVTPVEMQQ